MNPATEIGFGHFLMQSDALGQSLLALLLLMSVASWTVAALKALAGARQRRLGEAFLAQFWNARSLDEVRLLLNRQRTHDPFSALASQALHAQQHHARHGATRLAEAGTAGEFVTRTLRKALDEELLRLERGLTLLATVGVTAPFVGLFGTVWGVYHALVAIGISGAGTLDKVAGPVGEALIMTGLGLAVAIPAVIAYNVFARAIRVLAAKLDGFAFELHSFLTLGAPGTPVATVGTPAANAPALNSAPRPAAPAVPQGDLSSPAKPDLLRSAAT